MLSLAPVASRCAGITRNTSRILQCASYSRRPAHKPPLKDTGKAPEPSDKWNHNSSALFDATDKDVSNLPMVTANELERNKQHPRNVKMLARDFVEDSLYNPHYGYFSKAATIFDSSDDPFDFSKIRNAVEFQEEVAARYLPYGANEQLWHTPTELFKVLAWHSMLFSISTSPPAILRASNSSVPRLRVPPQVLSI